MKKIYLFACKEEIVRGYYRDELFKWQSGRTEHCRVTVIGIRETKVNEFEGFEEDLHSRIRHWCIFFRCEDEERIPQPLEPYINEEARIQD